jgi:hypothetical protein
MDLSSNINIIKNLENTDIKIDINTFQKMIFIFNSIEHGWSVKKTQGAYVFSKNHENKREIFEDAYLLKFIKKHMDFTAYKS